MNILPNFRRELSSNEMNRIILEKVPLDERLKAVYIPLIVTDCACYVGEDLLSSMRILKLSSTKKFSRTIRECIDGYRKENYYIMHSDLYRYLEKFTKSFYAEEIHDILILQLQYQQQMLNIRINTSAEKSRLLALAYIIKRLLVYVMIIDRQFSDRVSKLLGDEVIYTTEDNHYCKTMLESINGVLSVFSAPTELNSDKIDMAFKVFENKLNQIKVK